MRPVALDVQGFTCFREAQPTLDLSALSLFAITVVNYIDRAALSYAIPLIQRDLGKIGGLVARVPLQGRRRAVAGQARRAGGAGADLLFVAAPVADKAALARLEPQAGAALRAGKAVFLGGHP